MPRYVEGHLKGDGKKICIIVSRFNSLVTEKLLSGAMDALSRSGVFDDDVTVIRVPGSFEIPMVARQVTRKVAQGTSDYDAVVCLGAVVRGETPHFDYVSAEVSKGVAQVSLESGIPVIFGVLTTDTMEQALDRAGGKAGNKGFDAARAAIEMINLMEEMP